MAEFFLQIILGLSVIYYLQIIHEIWSFNRKNRIFGFIEATLSKKRSDYG